MAGTGRPSADEDSDGEAIMRDMTPEEMAQGMVESTRYVATVFLDRKHYQGIHQSLSNKWDRLHSLSAAMKLMESYGVSLTPAEEKHLATMEEGKQINFLVSKMPQQSNDSFQQFFLQLQLLVSTAMRVRRSLEEGRPDDVEQSLEDAETTGISQYILRVAIVQAGTEVRTLRSQLECWTKEADNKMGRLLRGQQDNITAQKKLAQAEGELARQNGEQNAKTAKAVINFANGNDKAFLQMITQQWQTVTKFMRIEGELKEEYADRLKDLEDNLAKWKGEQCTRTQNVIIKQIVQEQQALLGRTFDVWRKDVDDAKFMLENGDKVKALNEKLENIKAVQKENATKVLSSMASASEKGLVDVCFKGWVQVRHDTIKAKQQQDSRLASESKLEKFTQGKSEEAKYLVSTFAGASNTGLVHSVFTSWVQLWDENRREAEIAEQMHKSTSKMASFKSRNKASTGSVMNRASQHITNQLLLRVIGCWRLDAKMERTMKYNHTKIDAKRQQLVGVQQMFRNFAVQLEGGLNKSKGPDSSRIFDNLSVRHYKKKEGKQGGGGGGSGSGAQMQQNGGTRSMPEVSQKSASGRRK